MKRRGRMLDENSASMMTRNVTPIVVPTIAQARVLSRWRRPAMPSATARTAQIPPGAGAKRMVQSNHGRPVSPPWQIGAPRASVRSPRARPRARLQQPSSGLGHRLSQQSWDSSYSSGNATASREHGCTANGRMCADERGALLAPCALGHAMGAEPLHERGHLCWVGRVLGIDY